MTSHLSAVPTDFDAPATVARIVELAEQTERINAEIDELRRQLVQHLDLGTHQIAGVKVTVSAPSRRFNLDRALGMLNDEQKALVNAVDTKKVKSFLPPVLLEECMDPGVGGPVVRIS